MNKNNSRGNHLAKKAPIKHLLLIMRTTVILLFTCVFCSMAEMGYTQDAKVVINKSNVSLREVLNEIEKQTEYLFLYNNEVNINEEVSINARQRTVSDVLKSLLKDNGMEFSMEGNHIIITVEEKSENASEVHLNLIEQQQKKKVTGTITDESGQPIIGANIIEVGTANGTVTDVDGKFNLEIEYNALLRISYIGYLEQEIETDAQNIISVVLIEDTQALDELVVVGYGVQKKENLTGAVSVVSGDDLELRPVTDASQSLQGMVPGLFVNNASTGRPGATGSLSLRGQGNLSGSASPYILVDGVEMSLSDVNPADIESISVLKDAAASAIYGARAAYGVILVTTKRGEEGKMRVSYQGNIGWNTPTVLPNMVDSHTFAQYWNEGVTNTGAARLYSEEKLSLLKQYISDPTSVDPWFELPPGSNLNPAFENTEMGVGNVDYFDLHYKDYAFKQNHNLSFSGGGKLAQYYISGSYLTEDGILRYADMDYDRYNFSANITSQLTDWMKLRTNTKYMHSETKTPFGDGGLNEAFYHSMVRFRPTISEIDPNGNFTELSMVPYLRSGTYTNNMRDNLNLTIGLEFEPLKNWLIFADYTYRFFNSEYEALNKSPMIYAADGVTTSPGVRAELEMYPDGLFTRRYTNTRYQTINVYSNYSFSLLSSHNFSVMSGYQEEDSKYSFLKNAISGLYSTTNPNVAMGTGDKVVTDNRNGWATRGFFGRLNYDYQERYLLELNGRYDGSSRFAKDNRWGFFPSVSAGWNIAHENFMSKINHIVSMLKLRGSYGLLGNQAGAGLYTFASTMPLSNNLGNYLFDNGRRNYILPPGVIDPNTTWENVTSQNIGVDLGMFNNSLTGSFDLFQRDTKDMLGPGEDFPDFFGANAPQTNNANMRNRGWELTLTYRGKIGNDIDYSITGLLSDATSKVTKYANPTGTNPANNWYIGKKVGEIWGYRASGLIQTQEEADTYNEQYDLSFISGRPWTPGDVKFIDLNGDNVIDNGLNNMSDMGDMTIIGNSTPRYQYTFNGHISWKGIAMSMMLQGVAKRDWNPDKDVYFWGSGPYAQVSVFKEHLDYWSDSNPNAYYPKPYIHSGGGVVPYNNKTMTTSDRYLQNASYMRVKNITLSYDIPNFLISNIGINKLQIYFSGENLITFTPLKGMFDPEAIYTSNSYTSQGGKNYPMNKTLSFGAIINL